MSIAISGSSITFPDQTQMSTATGGSFRNRIINGDMRIDQRNAGASVTPTVTSFQTQYIIDRFSYQPTQASKFTFQQNMGSVTPPSGFTNYLGCSVASAYSVTSSDSFVIYQAIEGYNVADLQFGTANALTITLSFWVRSSLTGTFGGSLYNVNGTRSYPFSFAISSANAWEKKTITIAGDTTGTWATDNTAGLYILLSLGTGSDYLATANAWIGSTKVGVTGQVNVVGTAGATFYITGVQLEQGSSATDFERRPIGTELALCQRYYQKSYGQSVAPGTSVISTYNGIVFSNGVSDTATSQVIPFSIPLCPSMRSTPSLAYWDVNGNVSKFSTFTGGGFVRTDNQGGFGSTFLTSNALIAGRGVPAAGNCFGFAFAASSEL